MENDRPAFVILFMTYFIDETIIAEYRKLRRDAGPEYDVVLLYNTTERLPGEPPPDVRVFRFDERDLRRLRYPAKRCHVSSYNIELFVLNFWLANPQYEFTWVIEYDMRFSGNWSVVFDAFRGSHVDLIGTTMYRFPFNPDWANWPSLTAPPGVELRAEEKIAGFLPFYRISRRGLKALHEGYQAGWAGHCECTVPTILARAGLSIEDMGGDGEFVRPQNLNRFYRNCPKTRTHGPGTLVFRPVRNAAGEEPNLLWHPVKCAAGMVTARRDRMLRRAKILLRSRLGAVGL